MRAKRPSRTPQRQRTGQRPGRRAPLRVLFSCVGRRVELVECFQRAAAALDQPLQTWGTDTDRNAPAMSFVDKPRIVPSISDPSYIEQLIGLCRKERISLVVPLIDLELLALASARERFEAVGATVLISSPAVVAVCRDKLKAFAHLTATGIDTPATWTLDAALARKQHTFPYFVKPRSGSASTGLHVIENTAELRMVGHWVRDPIVQERIDGEEFTLDAYAGFDGLPACVTPRQRLRVRGGEVTQSRIVLDPEIIAVGRRVVESFRECVGPITIQVMRRPNGGLAVIEINPRFGGGVPLSIEAGADIPRWLLAHLTGRTIRIPPTAKRDGLMMIRYDRSLFRK